jgi:hypothetical protein
MIMLIFIIIIWMNEYPFGIDDDFSVIYLQIEIKINSFLSLGSGASFVYYMILRNNPQHHKNLKLLLPTIMAKAQRHKND